ncbi:MAG: heat-shock protein [Pseudomonadota bacterium]
MAKKKQLFNLPDSYVQQWKPFTYNGKTYNLDHLEARKHKFEHPERDESYTIHFTISNHAFTRSIGKNEVVAEEQIYPYPKDRRVFDETRYNLSKHLPQIIETLPKQFCYHGGHSRYCSCKLKDNDGNDIFYQVVYRAWKKSGKMRFHVESAYPLDGRPSRPKKVDFWVICHNLLRDKPMPKPAN